MPRRPLPNIRIVSLADAMLGREGCMVAAIREIGAGTAAYASEPLRVAPIGELDDLRLPLRAQQRSDRSLGAVEALSAFDQTSPLTSR